MKSNWNTLKSSKIALNTIFCNQQNLKYYNIKTSIVNLCQKPLPINKCLFLTIAMKLEKFLSYTKITG